MAPVPKCATCDRHDTRVVQLETQLLETQLLLDEAFDLVVIETLRQ